MPKKLEVDLKLNEEPIDFERFKGCGLKEGEKEMPSGEEEFEEPKLNGDIVNELIQMGIPELSAKHAVYNTNNLDVDMAVTWFYENIDNPVLQTPLPKVKKQGQGKSEGFKVNEEGMMMIMAMGMSDKQARRGLRKCNNDVERAMDFIFSHMDEPDSEDEMQVDQVSQAEEHKNAFENTQP